MIFKHDLKIIIKQTLIRLECLEDCNAGNFDSKKSEENYISLHDFLKNILKDMS